MKKFEKCDPPKVGFLRPKIILGDQEGFFGPHTKTQKLDFLRNLNYTKTSTK